jgi:hypothetical protein
MTAEAALKIVETNEVESKALTIVDQAKAITVTDADTYTIAGNMWKDLGDMMDKIDETFNPLIEAAHRSHKAALAKKAEFYNPLKEARTNIKKLMSDYDQKQERLRQEEQRRLEVEARRQEEERRLQDAILAEELGETEEASAILEEPVQVAPVIVPKATPKRPGGPVYREVWSAQVTDIKALCKAVADGRVSKECVQANMPALNKMATALKRTMNIPGVQAVSRRV